VRISLSTMPLSGMIPSMPSAPGSAIIAASGTWGIGIHCLPDLAGGGLVTNLVAADGLETDRFQHMNAVDDPADRGLPVDGFEDTAVTQSALQKLARADIGAQIGCDLWFDGKEGVAFLG